MLAHVLHAHFLTALIPGQYMFLGHGVHVVVLGLVTLPENPGLHAQSM
jgi:hypothetical protein